MEQYIKWVNRMWFAISFALRMNILKSFSMRALNETIYQMGKSDVVRE